MVEVTDERRMNTAALDTQSMIDTQGLIDTQSVISLVRDFLAANDPHSTDRLVFVRAPFDAGLAWMHHPEGFGGLGLPRSLQPVVDAEFAAAGAPDNAPIRNGIGLGMAAPTILRFGSEDQKRRFLRPLWTGEEVWCQLFSEPGAGSDLAALATRAVRDGTSGSSTGRRFGRRSPTRRGGRFSSPAPTPSCRNTAA